MNRATQLVFRETPDMSPNQQPSDRAEPKKKKTTNNAVTRPLLHVTGSEQFVEKFREHNVGSHPLQTNKKPEKKKKKEKKAQITR